LIGSSSTKQHIIRDYDTLIRPYAEVPKEYTYPNSIGTLQNMKISVYRKLGNEIILCDNTAIAISSFPEC
jgi:hypothetical protein